MLVRIYCILYMPRDLSTTVDVRTFPGRRRPVRFLLVYLLSRRGISAHSKVMPLSICIPGNKTGSFFMLSVIVGGLWRNFLR